MRKMLLALGIILSLQTAPAFAQDAQAEAKAAYLLAEESFGKGDYKTTLEFLKQAREALGAPNCKMLYLEIMTTRELYAKDSTLNSRLMALITEFEKSPDYATFNEEKSLEITKLKLLAKKEIKAAADKAALDAITKVAQEKNFMEIVNRWGKFGISLDEVDKAHPEWNVKSWEMFELDNRVRVYHPPSLKYTKSTYPFTKMADNDSLAGKLSGIVFVNEKLSEYLSYEVDYDQSNKSYQGTTYTIESDRRDTALAFITAKTGITPSTHRNYSIDGHPVTTYSWWQGEYMISDYELSYFRGKLKAVIRLLRVIQYIPANNNK